MNDITREQIFEVMGRKGYTVFDNSKPHNLNIVGIRSANQIPNEFDDVLFYMYKDNQQNWQVRKCKITTDPGLYWLKNPMNVEGTAILLEGQYLKSYKLGFHRGQYQALVQVKPVKVIRDFDRDGELDFSSLKIEEGLFGINIHRAAMNTTSKKVEKWSAGCQVFTDYFQFNDFISMCRYSAELYGNQFSYTLLNENDFSEGKE